MNFALLKRSLIIGLLALTMTGCLGGGGSDEQQSVVPNSKIFSVDEFDIEYPRDWRVLTSKDFPNDVPKETKLVFQQNVKGEFIVNVNLGRVSVPEGTVTMDYAKRLIQEQRNGLVNYQEIGREEIQLPVGEGTADTVLVTFTAKRSPEAVERKFVQTYLVKDGFAYVLTGAMRTNESETLVELVTSVLRSFKLK